LNAAPCFWRRGDARFQVLLEAHEIGRELRDGKLRTPPFAGGLALFLERGLRQEFIICSCVMPSTWMA
jgi:hypothetical protein